MSTPTSLRGVPTYADFLSKVEALYQHLEELHYVDQVLTFLDHIESMRDLQVVDNLILQLAHQRVHVGNTHPFTREVPLVVPKPIIAQKISAARSSAAAWAGTARRATLQRIDPWIAAYGHYFEAAHDTIARARDQLMFVTDDFAKLDHSLGHWLGPAAEDFDSNFYKPVDTIRDNQRYALEAMRCAIVFADGLSNLCKHSIMNALDAADKCALKQLEARSHDDRGSASEAFTILSLVTGLASAATFPAGPLSAGFAAVSVTLGYAAGGVDPDKDGTTSAVEARSADEVDAQVHAVVDLVSKSSQRHHAVLEGRLQATQENIAKFEEQGVWFTRAPEIVDGATSVDFFHESRQ